MMKRRSLIVKMVPDTEIPPEEKEESKVGEHLLEFTDLVLTGTAFIVGSYVLADTLRKIAIHTAKVKIK